MSKQIYEELLKAGAPELPDTWFYQVSDSTDMYVAVRVRVRQHRKYWFPKTLGEYEFDEYRNGLTKGMLVRACNNAYEEAQQSLRPRPDHLGELRRFIGKHP